MLGSRTDERGHFTIVDQVPADVVDVSISTQDAAGAWEVGQLRLEANTITDLGAISLE